MSLLHSTTETSIGLIGLGLMGSALAERLMECGFHVVGFDIREERRKQLTEFSNVSVMDRADDVLSRCEVVLLSLPTHHEVGTVLTECERGIRSGQIIIDTTTGEPASSVSMAQTLNERGIAYLDGTISGNSEQARRGEVVWMVGGERSAFDRCLGILLNLGREVFHTGPAGSGARMKLVTNLALGLTRAALAESLAFAEAIGITPAEALRVLKASAAYSRVMDTKGEKMLSGDFTPQATLSQHHKDVRLILAAAAEAGMELPLSATHEAILQHAEELGLGALDNSAVIQSLRLRK